MQRSYQYEYFSHRDYGGMRKSRKDKLARDQAEQECQRQSGRRNDFKAESLARHGSEHEYEQGDKGPLSRRHRSSVLSRIGRS